MARRLYGARAVSTLVIADDREEASRIADVLEKADLQVEVEISTAGNGPMEHRAFACVVIVASHRDGAADLCRRLRGSGHVGGIVVVARASGSADSVEALEAGADDFVHAPDSPELAARVRAVLRRTAHAALDYGEVQIDRAHRRAYLRRQALELTQREYALLHLLAEARGKVVSRADLLAGAWTRAERAKSNLVEVHISRLRAKFGADAALIETVRRSGYRLRR